MTDKPYEVPIGTYELTAVEAALSKLNQLPLSLPKVRKGILLDLWANSYTRGREDLRAELRQHADHDKWLIAQERERIQRELDDNGVEWRIK